MIYWLCRDHFSAQNYKSGTCFVVLIRRVIKRIIWLIYPYFTGLLHWHWEKHILGCAFCFGKKVSILISVVTVSKIQMCIDMLIARHWVKRETIHYKHRNRHHRRQHHRRLTPAEIFLVRKSVTSVEKVVHSAGLNKNCLRLKWL